MQDFRPDSVVSFAKNIALALALVIAAGILGISFANRNRSDDSIQVTGMGSIDFESDLVSWTGTFTSYDADLKAAFSGIGKYREAVADYLRAKGVDQKEIAFGAVGIEKEYSKRYSAGGDFVGETFKGYALHQDVKIVSSDVDGIEAISRSVTELINVGMEFASDSPDYFYTKLAGLKLDLIAKATLDAKERALMVTRNAGGRLGKLLDSGIGIFQITERNSSEEISWAGTYNTKARLKTATVTVKVRYKLD